MLPSKKLTIKLLPTLLAVVAMLLAACGGSGTVPGANPTAAAKAPESQQVYRWAVANPDIATFDPAQASDVLSSDAINMVFTGLVEINDKLAVTPELASSYDVSSDGLTYTFHLRSGLMFSDGTPLTSADVAYSIDRALSPTISNLSGISLTYLGLLKDAAGRTTGKVASLINDSVLTPDATTVVLKTSKPAAYFLQALTYPTAYVVEKKLIDKYGLKFTDHLNEGGGDGPFKVKSYNHSTGIVFVRNDNYWGPKAQLAEVDQNFYKTSDASYQAYLANQVDVTAVPSSEYPTAKTRADFSQTPNLAIYYFSMSYLAKPFDNVKIRQAFELALNKDAITTAIWKGRYTPTCHIIPAGMYGYNPNLQCPDGAPTAGDATKAKALLQQGMQEEGYSSIAQMPPIKITFESGSPDLANEVTTAIGMWQRNLGVTVGTSIVDFNTLLTATANTTGKSPAQGGLQMWALGWIADYPDPQDWTTLLFGAGSSSNNWNYGNNNCTCAAAQQANQAAMAAADANLDPTARAAAYNKIEQEMVDEVAWLSLFQSPTARLRKSFVVGFTPNAQGSTPPQDWGHIYITAH